MLVSFIITSVEGECNVIVRVLIIFLVNNFLSLASGFMRKVTDDFFFLIKFHVWVHGEPKIRWVEQ